MRKKQEEEETVGDDKTESVDKLVKHLIKEFNKGDEDKIAWNLATDVDNPTDVKDFISTGSTLLDYIMSNRRGGGVPVGKITEITGEESSGKSLLCAHIIANTQKKGGLAIYIDTENAANPSFMKQVGVDISKVVYLQPGTIEKVFETIEQCIVMARAKDLKKPVTIIWDSVAATPPQSELEGDYDPNSRVGVMAKAIAKGLRKITDTVGRERITLVFTNQLKVKIGVMYGDPMGTPGGKAIPYHASVRIRLTSGQKLKDAKEDNEIYGISTKAKVVKSRLGPPLRTCQFEIHFSHGVEDVDSWRDFLHESKEIEKRAGFMYIKDAAGNEVKFRERGWKKLLEEDEKLREHVLNLLERHLVKRYDDLSSSDVDPDSYMDAEAVVASVTESEEAFRRAGIE